MLPVLKAGQEVLVWSWFYEPKVGDIVVVSKNGKDIVKRIRKVSDRKYFVEGDNKKESTDSRSFGGIDKSELIGKVVFVVR